MAKVSKAQKGKAVAPVRQFTKKDWERKDSVPSEMFPGKMIPRKDLNYPKMSPPPMRKAAPVKKTKSMKSGGSFGMLSVKAGVDNNPKPTAADRIAGAKMNAGKSKSGGKVKMKRGGAMKKCKYGC